MNFNRKKINNNVNSSTNLFDVNKTFEQLFKKVQREFILSFINIGVNDTQTYYTLTDMIKNPDSNITIFDHDEDEPRLTYSNKLYEMETWNLWMKQGYIKYALIFDSSCDIDYDEIKKIRTYILNSNVIDIDRINKLFFVNFTRKFINVFEIDECFNTLIEIYNLLLHDYLSHLHIDNNVITIIRLIVDFTINKKDDVISYTHANKTTSMQSFYDSENIKNEYFDLLLKDYHHFIKNNQDQKDQNHHSQQSSDSDQSDQLDQNDEGIETLANQFDFKYKKLNENRILAHLNINKESKKFIKTQLKRYIKYSKNKYGYMTLFLKKLKTHYCFIIDNNTNDHGSILPFLKLKIINMSSWRHCNKLGIVNGVLMDHVKLNKYKIIYDEIVDDIIKDPKLMEQIGYSSPENWPNLHFRLADKIEQKLAIGIVYEKLIHYYCQIIPKDCSKIIALYNNTEDLIKLLKIRSHNANLYHHNEPFLYLNECKNEISEQDEFGNDKYDGDNESYENDWYINNDKLLYRPLF